MSEMFRMSRKKRTSSSLSNGKMSSGKLRLQEDIKELTSNDSCHFNFPNKDDLMTFEVTICPAEGIYVDANIVFSIKVPENYPHSPPKVKCVTKLLHPNIDKDGNVCLNILRQDWTPVLSINSIIIGLEFILIEPNTEDVLDEEVANLMKLDKPAFEAKVKRMLAKNGAYRKKD